MVGPKPISPASRRVAPAHLRRRGQRMPWITFASGGCTASAAGHHRASGMFRRYAWPSGNWGSMHHHRRQRPPRLPPRVEAATIPTPAAKRSRDRCGVRVAASAPRRRPGRTSSRPPPTRRAGRVRPGSATRPGDADRDRPQCPLVPYARLVAMRNVRVVEVDAELAGAYCGRLLPRRAPRSCAPTSGADRGCAARWTGPGNFLGGPGGRQSRAQCFEAPRSTSCWVGGPG